MAQSEHWYRPEKMAELERDGVGVWGAYRDFEAKGDGSQLQRYAIIDDAYARLYAANLGGLLRQRLNADLAGTILDAGSGIGTISEALRATGQSGIRVVGMDMSEAGVRVAAQRYPACEFRAGSVDKLDSFAAATFDVIHAREFYPFSRSPDAAFHLGFLKAFRPKLKPRGLVLGVQIVDKAGLADSWRDLGPLSRDAGYEAFGRIAMAPQRLHKRFDDAVYGPVYPLVAAAGHALEALKPGRVTYVYWWRARA
ncbi:MAG: methyltransferase domain-containing protein [Rhodospirillales bacterium]|nr:methyltransferase domain-containing protein [Rhodospirillales bacterium]